MHPKEVVARAQCGGDRRSEKHRRAPSRASFQAAINRSASSGTRGFASFTASSATARRCLLILRRFINGSSPNSVHGASAQAARTLS